MSLAYTTVRRQAAELADAGLLARGAEGFRLAESVFVDGGISYFAGADYEALYGGYLLIHTRR